MATLIETITLTLVFQDVVEVGCRRVKRRMVRGKTPSQSTWRFVKATLQLVDFVIIVFQGGGYKRKDDDNVEQIK